MPYKPTIGLEIHTELKTKSKMFCSCANAFGLEAEPNVHICPVCTGQPGSLPVINEEAVRRVIQTALALQCEIPDFSKFDRKNYFYPDLPKGYQISQYDKPLSRNGYLEIGLRTTDKKTTTDYGLQTTADALPVDSSQSTVVKRIRITRIHLEEDTGKLTHPVRNLEISNGAHPAGADYSLVDFNRAGVPLMELVTEPDIHSGAQARAFCQELQLILRYLGVSDADMEKGQMRCEVNISLRTTDHGLPPENIGSNNPLAVDRSQSTVVKPLGTKVEIKNLNSFRAVERAIDYEIKRQGAALDRGEKVIQETRGWDDAKGETYSQRIKEEAHDYRYFPEPDLPPLSGLTALSREIATQITELPAQKRARFMSEYGLPANDVEVLVGDPAVAEYFEKTASELAVWARGAEPKVDVEKALKRAVNYLITEIPRVANSLQAGDYILSQKITPENFAEFTKLTLQDVVSSSGAQTVLKEMFASGADPSNIIKEKDLAQVSDEETLNGVIAEILSQNPKVVEDYKKGKETVLMFLVGKVMAATRGKANPQLVAEILKKRIKKII